MTQIQPDSPAAEALEVDDRILGADGQTFERTADLTEYLVNLRLPAALLRAERPTNTRFPMRSTSPPSKVPGASMRRRRRTERSFMRRAWSFG